MAIWDRYRKGDLQRLEEFVRDKEGVEAYMEPRTGTLEQSVLLVARDGEWVRSSVSDRGQAAAFCKKMGVPFYDAAIVGYPDRMRGRKGAPAPEPPSADELKEWFSRETDDK